MDWQRAYTLLEAHLERLARGGVRHLNLHPDPELAESLKQRAAADPVGSAPEAPTGLFEVEPPGRGAPESQTREAPGAAEPPPAPEPSQLPVPPAPSPAEPPAVATSQGGAHPSEFTSLPALHAGFRECQRCGLAPGRSKLVFGVGHDKPRILFVGEGPGRDEDRQGLPFVGRAGQLLTAGIQALGLTRDDVYIANVVKCRPPDNRNPAPDEIAACLPILHRQMELLDPALIVTLGNVPLKTFNPSARGITAARGTPFTYRSWQVLPTFHPAYLLRNPSGLDAWWADLRRAFTMAYGESP